MDVAIGKTRDEQHSFNRIWFPIASLGIGSVSNLASQTDRVVRWRSGRIVVQHGQFREISGRWWPYQGNLLQTLWDIRLRPLTEDRCELYYHFPLGSPGFMSLSYVRSGPQTSLSTFYLATLALDHLAKLKQCSAVVCHVTNQRISDRLLLRWGWQPHCPDWPGRHYIKRFYGHYPEISPYWRKRLTIDNSGTES